jgi:uncharacterized protein (DUF924 family)
MTTGADDVLAFWFAGTLEVGADPQSQYRRWFTQSDAFDREIEAAFGDLPDAARDGQLTPWHGSAAGMLALVIVLDQFPRHLYRATPKAFAFDAQAFAVAESAIAAGFDAALHPLQAAFLYMPFQHAEDRRAQQRAVALYDELVDRAPQEYRAIMEGFANYARRHAVVVEQFGRFPHRNALLGRTTTAEEQAYLEGGGETFGVSVRPSP